LCISPDKIKNYLKNDCKFIDGELIDTELNRPVRAICVVHIFGNGADMESIMDIAEEYNLPVIEDATEAVGTFYTKGRYSGKMCGTIGDFGAYSFNGNKIITTGGGGMLTAKDGEKLKKAKYLSVQAKDDEIYFVHGEVGYNYRMTNLQAALGIAQLEQLEQFIHNKKNNYEFYNQCGISLLPFSEKIRPNYWFYSYMTENRDGLINYLKENNIQARPIWKLNHTQKPYHDCKECEITKAAEFYDKIVNVPCSANLTSEEVRYVADKILTN
jgi:dTDP-4-amino-4,6-dideoxygalactose transaminase